MRYANFDAERVELVVGGDRAAVLAAAHRLAARHRRDVQELGRLPSLFAFFFTGHGLAGRLLTPGEPLAGSDSSAMVREMDATLTVGVFDACQSGAFDWEALKEKGAVATPGFNPIAELPKEVLDAEGTMWFVSSRPGELSYEDEQLGGLFTHFFTESFTAAQPDGVGITLESMWEFARRRTAAHAARYGRRQTPERVIRNLKAGGPLYFSFPRTREATLRFHAELEGSFLLNYEQSALVEKVVKAKGTPLDVAVWAGQVSLSRLGPSEAGVSRQLSLVPGQAILLAPEGLGPRPHAPGFADQAIRSKGELVGIAAVESVPRSELSLGLGYRFQAAEENLLVAGHGVGAGLSLVRGPLDLAVLLGLGRGARAFPSWSYEVLEANLFFAAGYGFDLGHVRLDLEAQAAPALQWGHWSSGARRTSFTAWVGGGARLLIPLPVPLHPALEVRGGLGVRWATGVAYADDALHAGLAGSVQAGVLVPLGGR
ncbi:MAG: caspase family protein [Myxococcales bacterium]